MITVVSATAFKVNQHAIAINRTRDALPMESKGILISHTQPDARYKGEWAKIPDADIPRGQWNRDEYSWFILEKLADYVDTDFCIVVQWDGFAVHPNQWQDDFLAYDYIGAPWPTHMNIGRVGNGGFSLRSRRWLRHSRDLLKAFPFNQPQYRGSEDYYSCLCHRDKYTSSGLLVAPVPVAMRWSIEHRPEEFRNWDGRNSFGFHAFYSDCNHRHRLRDR